MYAELKLKICSRCKEGKPQNAFYARSDRPTGLMSHCKACNNEQKRDHKKRNPNVYKLKEFKRGLRRHYGLSELCYEKLFREQNGKCACCGKPEANFKKKLHVDHDHSTGQVRALLCTQCNPGLGYFEESIERLEMAIEYLKKHKKLG